MTSITITTPKGATVAIDFVAGTDAGLVRKATVTINGRRHGAAEHICPIQGVNGDENRFCVPLSGGIAVEVSHADADRIDAIIKERNTVAGQAWRASGEGRAFIQRLADEHAFDQRFNEGGEGYNPYRAHDVAPEQSHDDNEGRGE